MACDTRLKENQTIQQRAKEVREAAEKIAKGIASGRIRVIVSPQGAVAFVNVTAEERDGVTDACAYRRIMSTGSALARQKIAAAEQLSGRAVNRQVIGQGVHSHDDGKSWHSH